MIELVPVTSIYAGLCGMLIVALAVRVALMRRRNRIGYGDGGLDDLGCAIRAHSNAVEYVPLALVLLLLLEINGIRVAVLHVLGSVLVAGRLGHAWGLSHSKGVTAGRMYGTVATWLVIFAAGLLNIVL